MSYTTRVHIHLCNYRQIQRRTADTRLLQAEKLLIARFLSCNAEFFLVVRELCPATVFEASKNEAICNGVARMFRGWVCDGWSSLTAMRSTISVLVRILPAYKTFTYLNTLAWLKLNIALQCKSPEKTRDTPCFSVIYYRPIVVVEGALQNQKSPKQWRIKGRQGNRCPRA